MTKAQWIWMPHPAHYCAANNCRFRLATCVGAYIVSTVGEYFPEGTKTLETVGLDRLYETMVSHASSPPKIHECGCIESRGDWELDFAAYNDAKSAYEGHLKLCRKWAKQK